MEDGATIGGLADHTPGSLSHVGAVKVYLKNALPLWLDRSPYKEQVGHMNNYHISGMC